MRKIKFVGDEYYHIYNRGVEKINLFKDGYDFQRFLQSMNEFNCIEPIGSIYENSFNKKNKQLGSLASKSNKLVEFVVYCVNPNHYHFIFRPLVKNGIEKFMHRLGTGYTKYFNEKYKRSGALFQGTYKAIHIDSDSYLRLLSVYINLNYKVHKLGSLASKFVASSWGEYIGEVKSNFCNKDIVLGQFDDIKDYKKFAKSSLKSIIKRREELKKYLIE